MLLPALMLLQAPTPPAVPSQVPAARAPTKPVPPARIEMTTPFPVHLGSVGPREVREAVYGIKSLHDRPFRFRVLDLSPGLSVDEGQLAEPLQPGEVRRLAVKVDPAGFEGYLRGAVRLGTDDPAQPNYILRYDMTVRPEVGVDGLRKSLGEVAPHESPEARFRFTREGGELLKLALASVCPPYLDLEWLHEGAAAELRVTLRPARLPAGTQAGLEVIKVATNAPRQPVFTLYLDWRMSLPVVPSPARVVFSEVKTTLEALELTARDGRPFRIREAHIEGPGFQLIDPVGGEAVRHVLRIRRTGRNPEGMLVLHCSNLEAPLRVPLRFLDPRARPDKVALPEPREHEPHVHRH